MGLLGHWHRIKLAIQRLSHFLHKMEFDLINALPTAWEQAPPFILPKCNFACRVEHSCTNHYIFFVLTILLWRTIRELRARHGLYSIARINKRVLISSHLRMYDVLFYLFLVEMSRNVLTMTGKVFNCVCVTPAPLQWLHRLQTSDLEVVSFASFYVATL